MNMKPKKNHPGTDRAVMLIIIIALINLVGVVLFLNISRSSNISFMTGNMLTTMEKNFEDYENNLKNILESTIDALQRNEKMAEIFLTGDREALYNYSKEMFDHFISKQYFTHWYFLNKGDTGTCFLRMHNKKLYGDRITRFTYQKCVETGRVYSGKELGKTAFAIRVVHPWMYKKEHIGFLELAIEIEAFFENLKHISGAELGLVIDKSYLDKSKWESVRREKRLHDNWDDHETLLLIDKTSDRPELIDLSRIDANFPSTKKILSIEKIKKSHYMKGTLPLFDASGRKVGLIYFLKDVSVVFNKLTDQATMLTVIVFFFLMILTFFMIFFHKRAESQLRIYRENLEELIEERTEELKKEFTARLKAEMKQVEAVKLAERSSKMASLGVMAAGISHEINQPLNAIKVSADSALFRNDKESGELDEKYISKLKNISEGADRISEIIQTMRNFWILPESTISKNIDLDKAVDTTFNLIGPQLKKNGIEFIHKRSKSPLLIKGEPVHMEQIMMNLISNALNSLKNTDKENKFIHIRTSADKEKIYLEIDDNGEGLPDIEIEQLTDPFYSTGKHRSGTGLGLAIVSHYVKKYKGCIKAENNRHGGASFKIEFPLGNK